MDNKEESRKTKCANYMKNFDNIFKKFLETTTSNYDGLLFLPIQEGCAKEVLEHMKNYKIKSEPKLSFNECNCINIRMDTDKEFVAYAATYDCNYYNRKSKML